MNSDSEEGELPDEIGYAASDGDFERVKAWLAGASDPRSVNASDGTGWTLLHWTVLSDQSPEQVEFARYLISQGARIDAKTWKGETPLHMACDSNGRHQNPGEETAAMVSMLVAAGTATVNMGSDDGRTPLFSIDMFCKSTIDVVTALLGAGASLDFKHRDGWTRSFEEHLNEIEDPYGEHVGAVRNLVASVRAAGSWKAHCRLAHKQVLRLRSLVVRGRAKLRTRRRRDRHARQKRALEFVVRQGDNGIVWHILSFWRATA